MAITATELELLECFGAEPSLSEANIHPSYVDLEFVVTRNDYPIYELKAIGAADVRVLDFPDCDVFEIWLSTKEWLRIQLRPRFGISHGYEKLPSWSGVKDIEL